MKVIYKGVKALVFIDFGQAVQKVVGSTTAGSFHTDLILEL